MCIIGSCRISQRNMLYGNWIRMGVIVKDKYEFILYFITLICGISIIIYGCSRSGYEYEPVENHQVIRVLIRNPGDYLVISDKNGLKEEYVHGQVVMDVPKNEKCWYTGQLQTVRGMKYPNGVVNAIIHIHNQSEIDGGHIGGKFPVQNQVIE